MVASVDSTQSLSTVFVQLLQIHGLKSRYFEARLQQLWPRVMGTAISTHTTSLRLTEDVLYVGVSSAVLRWELITQQEALRERLNAALGEALLSRIVVK